MPDSDIEALIRLNTLVADRPDQICRARHDGRGTRARRQHRLDRRRDRLQRLSVYAASKAALVGFTASLAREVGRVGVTVNAIAPGFVDTEMTRGCAAQRDRIVARSALRRLDRPRGRRGNGALLMGEGPKHHRRGADGRRRRHGVITRNICHSATLTSPIIAGTSTSGPMTAAKATPELTP